MGEICVGLSIVPKETANSLPAGFGRSDPNANPFLSPPVGRMQLSINPFVMMKELLGPKAMTQVMICCFCLVCVLLMVFAGPVVNIVIAILSR